MKLDKGTLLIGVVAALVTLLVATRGGPVPVTVGAVAAGVAGAALWQLWQNRQAEAARQKTLAAVAESYALPGPTLEGGVSRFLRPEEEVVGYWPRPELDQLTAWVSADDHSGVRLVTGPGGTGKTRLARQLARQAGPMGFRAWWAPPGPALDTARAGLESGQPALIVLDYAETRHDLGDTVAAVLAHRDGPPTRVLLLARSAGEWWQRLITGSGYQASEALAAISPITLGALPDETGQAQVFAQALNAFAARLGMPCPAAELALTDKSAPVLVVHTAALLAVLQQPGASGTTSTSCSTAEALAKLLRHEARYWQQSQATRGLNLDTDVTRRVVGVGCLIGADDEKAAAQLLAVIPDLGGPATRARTARWLHDLYPVPAVTPGAPEWIGSLRPDRLAEQLAVTVLTDQAALIPALFSGLGERRAARPLTTLARASLADPTALPLLGMALRSDLDDLAVPAMAVAVETNPAVGDLLHDALTAAGGSAAILGRIADALPYPSLALASTAAFVHGRLAELASDDPARRARHLRSLSNSLSDLGRREEALAAIDQAVALYLELAAERPDAFRPDLAESLNSQSICLAYLGRSEEALAASEQAAAVQRELAAERLDAFRPGLAGLLGDQSIRLLELGRWGEALAAIEQAVVGYRELAAESPDAFRPNLAASLNAQSACLAGLGRWEEALAAIEQAVAVRRELAAERPDAFRPGLAVSLTNQSNCLAGLGRLEEALAAIKQAVALYLELAADHPDTFRPTLAASLNNQSLRLADLGRWEEALAAIEQAVAVRRELAAAHPDIFRPSLARSLGNLADVLTAMGRDPEAAAIRAEARALDFGS